MVNLMKKLPIGIQTFSEIIKENYLYIDKTAIALNLINNNKYVFLSRPRRFGKSLFLDTLKNIFEGNKDLFKGLAIYNKYDWNEKHPVIKISFSGGIHSLSSLSEEVLSILNDNQQRLGIECLEKNNINLLFKELIKKAYEKYREKVVILIDEYDKPILDNLENLKVAKILRDGIRDFYTKIKDNDEYIQFAFLTGVSKFSKTSIFSGLNNLTDVSLDRQYGDICGYTQNDLETSFKKHLEGVDFTKVKEWYNGYNFLGNKVYNPFDILLFISKDKLYRNYWFETGTPAFLINLIKQNNYFIPNFENIEIDESLVNSFDIEDLSLETIMFQAGYLTIKEVINEDDFITYQLGFPNKEVKISFNNYVLDSFLNRTLKTASKRLLLKIFKTASIKDLEQVIKELFASIAYNNFTKNEIQNYEGFYASVLYAYFASLGVEIIAEDVTNYGRIDLTIKFADKVYLFEFKVIDEDPLKQMKERKYYEKYSGEVYLIGIVFDKKARNVSKFEYSKI